MPFTTTAVRATSFCDGKLVIFVDYEDCATNAKYTKVIRHDNDVEYVHVFDENDEISPDIKKINEFCKKTSYVNYIEDQYVYVVMGVRLFGSIKTPVTLMMRDKNIIGEITDSIDVKTNNCLSIVDTEFYRYVSDLVERH